jgi:hypothetical protein
VTLIYSAVDGGFTLATAGVVDLVIGWPKSAAEERKAYADARKADTKYRLFCSKSIEQDSAFTHKADPVENHVAATPHPSILSRCGWNLKRIGLTSGEIIARMAEGAYA